MTYRNARHSAAIIIVILLLSSLIWGCKGEKPSSQENSWVEVPVKMEELKALQAQVDEGHRPGLLDPRQVAYEFLESQLKIPGSKVKEMKEISAGKSERQLLVTLEDGKKLELVLVQPVKKGPTGIWCVKRYRQGV